MQKKFPTLLSFMGKIDEDDYDIDIGIWMGNFAYLIKRHEEEINNVKTHLAREESEIYAECVEYFNQLRKLGKTYLFTDFEELIAKNQLNRHNTFSDLQTSWMQYVECPKRMLKLGLFLDKVVKWKFGGLGIRILDTAGRTGCESEYFAVQNSKHVITYNETDEFLYMKGTKILKEQHDFPNSRLCRYDIKQLRIAMYPRRFDLALLLANAISLESTRDDVLKCLWNINKVLVPGGLLIIDHRNYKKIFRYLDDMRQKGEECSPTTFYTKDYYSGDYFFCGTNTKGWPIDWWVDNSGPKPSKYVKFRYGKSNTDYEGELVMYAFEEDDLKFWLKDAGFSESSKFYDLGNTDRDPDFITYVAVK